MEVVEAVGAIFLVMFWIVMIVLTGLFIFWIARILIIIPDRLTRITVAFEKIANKK